ncbi:putative leucine-rich repeat-containing protein DDB_G0290503 [Hetaerina americana]|uniref:putative leucine-rich repeat-containing protein DDB_G0290503 n=1 Tax=Hetaerina americana TaxID=62018 RepID=UPI003A7F30D0
MDDPNFELLGDLSTEDFQQKLHHWLEERGTLPILRTYLRHQLISTLKHTHPRSTLLSKKRTHLSPKIHAINLLLAEHLLAQNYHFTISILYSEEPRLGRFPSQMEQSAECMDSSNYLQGKDVEDILGTLNLRTDSKLGKKVVNIYFGEKKKDKSASLLRAIFEALSENETIGGVGASVSVADASTRSNRMDEDQQLFSAVSAEPGVKPTNLGISAKSQLLENHEKAELSQSYGESIKKHLMEWNQKELEKRIKEEARKVREDLEKEAASQKRKFKEDVLLKQQQFLDIMNQLQDQQAQVKLHLKQIQQKEDDLRDKESKLEETLKQKTEFLANRHNDIVRAQKQLVEGFKKLNQEKDTVQYLQKEMEIWRNQVLEETAGKSPSLLQFHNSGKHSKTDGKGIQQQANDNIPISDTMNVVHSIQTLHQEAIQDCHQMVSEVKEKNERLQTLADEQQSKINALSSTASQLSKQLEEAKAALRLLSSHDSHPSDLEPKNSLEERVTVLSMMQDEKKRSREGLRRPIESVEGGTNRFRYFRDGAHRKLRGTSRTYRQHSSDSESSSASSPTEEIIQEARRRLERLEKESDEVDKQFFMLRQKHLADTGGTSGLGYSDVFPGTLRESVPMYNHMSTILNGALPVTTPYQLLQGNAAVKVLDEHPDLQPYQGQDAQYPGGPVKNQPHISVPTNSNLTFPPPITRLCHSLRTESKNGMESMQSASGVQNNNARKDSSGNHVFRIETEGNSFHSTKTALPSSSEVPVGFEHLNTNLTFKNDHRQIFQSHNDFPTKENQRSVHFEMGLDERNGGNGRIKEKNHFSAVYKEADKNNIVEQLGERMEVKTKEGSISMMADPLPLSVVDVNKENNQKKGELDGNAHGDVLSQETDAFRTKMSVSSGEDSSSPKLSIGIDDSKEKDHSELW